MRQEPHSIRTPAPQSYAPQSYAPQSYPAPAPQSYAPPSAFVRQAAPTPYGFTQQQYGHRNDLSAPPPPHSLAPMAMSADSTNRQFSTTGVTRAHNGTMSGREKPSLKWGIMIALSGALLGGVLGLGMDARRQSARAAAASEAKDAAPPAMVATALPVAPVQPVVVAPRAAAPAALPLAANALTAPAVIAPPAARAPVVLAAAPAIVVPKTAAHPRAALKPHAFLAAKVTPPSRPAPEPKVEAPEPKVAKTEAPKAAPKKDASTSDAMKILEAANKDTTNTL